MTTIFSPNNIEVLLHCHTCVEPHPRLSAPAVVSAISERLEEGAIYSHKDDKPHCYRTTEKGRAWVAALCAVPPPVQCWKDGVTGRVIEV